MSHTDQFVSFAVCMRRIVEDSLQERQCSDLIADHRSEQTILESDLDCLLAIERLQTSTWSKS